MKSKFLLLASALVLSVATFAQKDELKTLKKIYGREKISDSDIADYKANLSKAEALVANSTEDDKVYFGFYKAMAPILELNAALANPEKSSNPNLASQYLTVDNLKLLVSNLNATVAFEKNQENKFIQMTLRLKLML